MDNIDFDEVLISPAMIQDHMPDTVLSALNKVSARKMSLFYSAFDNIISNFVFHFISNCFDYLFIIALSNMHSIFSF